MSNARREYLAEWARKRREWLHGLKDGKPCLDCGGVFHPVAMSFHHRDPATKSFSIGAKVTRSKEKILAEIEKCDLLCANCHMIREYA